MAASFRNTAAMREALDKAKWALFTSLERLTDARADAAARLRRELAALVAADEYVSALAPGLPALEDRAISLLTPAPPPPTPPEPAPPGPEPGPNPNVRYPAPRGGGAPSVREGSLVREGSTDGLDRERLRRKMAELDGLLAADPAARIEIAWKIRRREEG